jgi:hypothetical protein
MLFPLGIFCLSSIYFMERIQMARFYKKPPLYDMRLQLQVLDILGYAPIPMFLFGYWFLGNRQMFFNEAHHVEYKSEIVDLKHNLFYSDLNHSHPMLLFLFVVIF